MRTNIFLLCVALFALLLPLRGFSSSSNNFVQGSIHLKGGEILNGWVRPLGDFANPGTVFKTDKNSDKIIIPHQQIIKIAMDKSTLVPAHININGQNVPAYLEAKAVGAATLYKAQFYAPRFLGKNNSVVQLQWTWVLHTPHKGLVVLGHQPVPSDLVKWLQHPLVKEKPTFAKLDEEGIIQAVNDHNEAVRAVITGVPKEQLKDER